MSTVTLSLFWHLRRPLSDLRLTQSVYGWSDETTAAAVTTTPTMTATTTTITAAAESTYFQCWPCLWGSGR